MAVKPPNCDNLQFVIDEKFAPAVKTQLTRINTLFGVCVQLEKGYHNKHWITITGPDHPLCKTAKDYILALISPEVSISLKSLRSTKAKLAEIERSSGAVLSRCEDYEKTIVIKGTEFAVSMAMSLIDEMHASLTKSSGGSPRQQPSSRKPGGKRDAVPLSPHGREQQAYLRSLALELKHGRPAVEQALARLDMNDVICPAQFIELVVEIGKELARNTTGSGLSKNGAVTRDTDRRTASKNLTAFDPDASVVCLNSSTTSADERDRGENAPASIVDPDASVICLDSSDEETYVMRPFGEANNAARGSSAPGNTIVVSSDDELENQRPHSTKRNRIADSVEHRKTAGREWSTQSSSPLKSASEVNSVQAEHAEGDDCVDARLRQEFVDAALKAPAAPQQPRSGLRYIVIDGSNVAMCHGNNMQFSVPGIEICIKYFISRGHKKITAFVPESRRYTNQVSSSGRALLDKLFKAGFVKFTPARRVGNRTITSYDDRFVLNLAVKEEGIVVSNDLYRDLQMERSNYQDVINNRLLLYTFVENHFMPPEDPLGRNGPSLDQFLRHPELPRPAQATAAVPARPQAYSLGRTTQNDEKNRNTAKARWLPPRSASDTEKLFIELIKIFPEPHQIARVRDVLRNHKQETDLNRLSDYCIQALSIT